MNALALRFDPESSLKEIPEVATNHLEVLVELLRDVNLEKRMMTLIKAEGILREGDYDKSTLESIRTDLEEDLQLMRKMIFMVEQVRYFTE